MLRPFIGQRPAGKTRRDEPLVVIVTVSPCSTAMTAGQVISHQHTAQTPSRLRFSWNGCDGFTHNGVYPFIPKHARLSGRWAGMLDIIRDA